MDNAYRVRQADAAQQPGLLPTQLTGWKLSAGRVAYALLTGVALVLWLMGTAAFLSEPPVDCRVTVCDPASFSAADLELMAQMGWPAGLFRLADLLASTLGVVFFVAAGIIALKRSHDWLALVASFTLVFMGAAFVTSSDDALLRAWPAARIPLNLIQVAGLTAYVVLLFTFPNGRFVPDRLWARRAVPALTLVAVLLSLVQVFRGSSNAVNGVFGIFSPLLIAGLVAQAYRYWRVSNTLERRQTQWILLGLAGIFLLNLLWISLRAFYPPETPSPERIVAVTVTSPLLGLLGLLFPLTFVFSILRYRLWDIDVFIRRTVQYTLVTGTLIVVYFGLIVVLQQLFTRLMGEPSTIAVVLSTLAIAALFNPLRRRVQGAIDRRFYRRKYDAEQVLEEFAATARDETDLDVLTAELVHVIEETMQPEFVSIWLAPPEEA